MLKDVESHRTQGVGPIEQSVLVLYLGTVWMQRILYLCLCAGLVSAEGSVVLRSNPRAEGLLHKSLDRVQLFKTAPDDQALCDFSLNVVPETAVVLLGNVNPARMSSRLCSFVSDFEFESNKNLKSHFSDFITMNVYLILFERTRIRFVLQIIQYFPVFEYVFSPK